MAEMTIDSHDPLASAGWAQRLGRALAAEGLAAEDALQDTWVAVLEGRMKHGASPAGWFGKVARNFALLGRRRDEAVHRGEQAAARPEIQEERPVDIVARAEVMQRVVAAVLELREPYRSTLLMRYLDELSAEEIAARQGVPGSTVRNRLRRGLEEVRQRFGGRMPVWSVVLAWLPFSDSLRSSGSSWTARLPEVLIVTKGTKIAVASVATLVFGAWVWTTLDEEGARALPGNVEAAAVEPTPDAESVPLAGPANGAPDSTSERREAFAQPVAEEPSVVEPALAALAQVFARSMLVVDLNNEPVPDAELELEENEGEEGRVAHLLTDAAGRCEVRHAEGELEVTAFKEGLGIARTDVLFARESHGKEVRLRLAEPIRLTGIVLDAQEKPVAGATVEPRMQGLILTEDMPFHTPPLESDAEGRFEFLLHSNGMYRLEATFGEERSQAVEVSKMDGLEREVELRLMGALTIEGTLLDFERNVVPRGLVRIDSKDPEEEYPTFTTSMKTDEQGRFHFALPAHGDFLLVGSSPYASKTALDIRVGAAQPRQVVELLLDPPDAITGTVLWEDGRPAAGCRIEAWSDDTPMPGELGFELTPEHASMYGYAVAVADADGAFEVAPLRAGELYSLALQPNAERKRARARYHEIPAGTVELELRVSEELMRGAFAYGSISSSLQSGAPENVQIQLKWRAVPSDLATTRIGSWSSDRNRVRLTGTGPWRPFDGTIVDGQYEFAHLIPERQYVLYFTADGHGTSIVGPWIASEDGTQLDVVLDAVQTLEVAFVRGDGLPATHAAASIVYLDQVEALQFFGQRYTDDDGAIVYEDVLPGEYALTMIYKGASTRQIVTVPVGASLTRTVVTLD